MPNNFTWNTKFKSIIIVDGELFQNEYFVNLHITPYTADLKEQTKYFERLKSLFKSLLIFILDSRPAWSLSVMIINFVIPACSINDFCLSDISLPKRPAAFLTPASKSFQTSPCPSTKNRQCLLLAALMASS